jgi:hypothetical protein
LRRTSNAEKFVKRPVMQLDVRVDEAAAVDPGAAVVRWQTRFNLERFPMCCAYDTKCPRVATRMAEQVIIPRSDNCAGIWIAY